MTRVLFLASRVGWLVAGPAVGWDVPSGQSSGQRGTSGFLFVSEHLEDWQQWQRRRRSRSKDCRAAGQRVSLSTPY